jgi:hypothetical protein
VTPGIDDALAAHDAGRLDDTALADALAAAEVFLAVTGAGAQDTVDPFVFEYAGADHAAAFTSVDGVRAFSAKAPFVRLPFRVLAAAWPAGLGLVVNPAGGPSVTLRDDQVRAVAARAAARPDDMAAARVEPAGGSVRIGAPEPGLPADALAVLRASVAASADVTAAYPLAWAADGAAPRLVVGLRLAADTASDAVPRFADDVTRRDARFGSLDFVELRGNLLSSAQQFVEPVV